MGFFKRLFGQEKKESLDQGLAKSKQGVMERIAKVFTGRRRIDDDLLDDLEEADFVGRWGGHDRGHPGSVAQASHMGGLRGPR